MICKTAAREKACGSHMFRVVQAAPLPLPPDPSALFVLHPLNFPSPPHALAITVTLQSTPPPRQQGFSLHSDGKGHGSLTLGYDGEERPLGDKYAVTKGKYGTLGMNGREVYKFATLEVRKRNGGGWGGVAKGTCSFVACLNRLTIDHASLSRRSNVPACSGNTYKFWALVSFVILRFRFSLVVRRAGWFKSKKNTFSPPRIPLAMCSQRVNIWYHSDRHD